MASSKAHYEALLAEVYAWMLGGFEAGLASNRDFFDAMGLAPAGTRLAVDLGAGCGFQSIPLAERGFRVVAIDLDRELLAELESHARSLDIRTVAGDLLDFRHELDGPAELVVCMTDTLLHLEDREAVRRLFADAHAALASNGRFVLTFRDLTHELVELDRFIPVRSDEDRIMTCFLEYEPVTVKVHDLVYRRNGSTWRLDKSFYRKLRLSPDWVARELERTGFAHVDTTVERGLVTTIATR